MSACACIVQWGLVFKNSWTPVKKGLYNSHIVCSIGISFCSRECTTTYSCSVGISFCCYLLYYCFRLNHVKLYLRKKILDMYYRFKDANSIKLEQLIITVKKDKKKLFEKSQKEHHIVNVQVHHLCTSQTLHNNSCRLLQHSILDLWASSSFPHYFEWWSCCWFYNL